MNAFKSVQEFDDACLELAEREPLLETVINEVGLPVPVFREPDFQTLVHIILEQQVSLASAAAVFKRLQDRLGPVTTENISTRSVDDLRTCGITRMKSEYIVGLAKSVIEQNIELHKWSPELKQNLLSIRGIGPWTVDIYFLMALRGKDIWPASDLALATAVKRLQKAAVLLDNNKLTKLAEPWQPYRSAAAQMLWNYYLQGLKN